MWAASGSEAIQKALWAAHGPRPNPADDPGDAVRLPRQEGAGERRHRDRKPIASAIRACGSSRSRWLNAAMCRFATRRSTPLRIRRNLTPCSTSSAGRSARSLPNRILAAVVRITRRKPISNCSSDFCRANDIVFILDEVQANFGRTGAMFAFETYGLEPDIVVLGKGLGNGVPVAAAVGRADLFAALEYGEGSDTWSANPLCCAAVLATLDEFHAQDVLGTDETSLIHDREWACRAQGVSIRRQCSR